MVNVKLNGVPVSMELDTGASQSIKRQRTFGKLWDTEAVKLSSVNAKLHTYTKELIPEIFVGRNLVGMNISDIGSVLRSVYQLEDSLVPANSIGADPDQPGLPQHRPAVPPPDSQGPCNWFDTDPQFWGEEEVLQWLNYYVARNRWDSSSIFLAPCDASGKQLCAMSLERFIRTFGYLGEDLYRSLRELREKYEFEFELPNGLEDAESRFPPTGEEHGPCGMHLWKFILNILQNPDRNPGLLKWEDRMEGTFRFLQSDAVAQLWGQKKNNNNMTYSKLSRAMRYYYQKGILERVDGRRLVYKFGKNASGWKRVE
uniref:ETS-related transcription factor Elf-5-like n=1 Tax=Pristiophorus japonicus TaxID=55135 RepID=UPI00398E9E48